MVEAPCQSLIRQLSAAGWAGFALQGSIVAGIASISVARPEACDAHAFNMPISEFSELVQTDPTKARSHVECGRIDVTGKLPSPKGRIPIIFNVIDSYFATPSFRSKILRLLTAMFKAGADPNTEFKGKSGLWIAVKRGDVALCRCLVQAGAKVADAGHLLRFWAHEVNSPAARAKELFRLQSEFKKSMMAASSEQVVRNASSLIDPKTMHDLASRYEQSVTAQQAVLDIRSTTTDYPSKLLYDIDADVFDGLLKQISKAPGFDFQHVLASSRSGHTIFHISAKGSPRIISSLVGLAIASGREAVASMLKTLYSADDLGRTAFHIAAIRYGTGANDTLSNFGAWLRSAKQCSEILGSPWKPKKILSKPDVAGFTVAHYAASTMQHPHVYTKRFQPRFQEYTKKFSGGWSVSRSTIPDANSNRCDILELQSPVDKDEFMDLIMSGKPVMLRREALKYKVRNTLRKSNLLTKHGSVRFKVGTIPYSELFGKQEEVVTLREFVKRTDTSHVRSTEIPPYIFETIGKSEVSEVNSTSTVIGFQPIHPIAAEFDEMPHILQHVRITGVALILRTLQFYLGPPQSGAPMHFHVDAVNILAFGRKKWFMYPPSDAIYSQDPTLVWNRSGRTKSATQPWECTQNGGDVLFVPNDWAHATLNIEESIGVAYEFSIPHMSGVDIRSM